jgi:2',3'-cyclic-nucleotide 2'-phosphodiesterase (5'-nucleotidase family)
MDGELGSGGLRAVFGSVPRLLFLVPALALPTPLALADEGREDTVLLLHTNDFHGHIENAASLAGLARRERARRPDVLWLDAGDMISGTPVSTVHKGVPIFTVASAMGIDAACLGNHEFDYGYARIAAFREAATFPLLAANARDPDDALLADAEWKVFNVDGVRVGVIGLVTENTPRHTVKAGNHGVQFEAAKKALKRLVPEVRKECDLLIALTHLGYDEDIELARSQKGVDVIVGGHTHTDLPGPVQIGDTVVVQAFRYGERLGRVELTVDMEKRRLARWEGKPLVIEPGVGPKDEAVARLVADLEGTVESLVGAVIAEATEPMSKAALNDMAETAFRDVLETDFGLNNIRGVRETLAKGPVSIRHIWTVFPFDNTLIRVKVKAARLPEHLKKKARDALGGKDPDPDRIYTVAVNSYMADHLKLYLPGAEEPVEDTGISMRDSVVDWVRNRKKLP